MASLLPGFRRAVPRISRSLFACPQCLPKQNPATWQPMGKSQAWGNIRFSSTGNATANTPLGSLGRILGDSNSSVQGIGKSKLKQSSIPRSTSSGFFPPNSSKSVAYWLLASAGSVFGIVVFGGLTRLTESGLVPFVASEV